MKKLILIASVLLLSSKSFAVYNPDENLRPVLGSYNMDIVESRYGFEKVDHASITYFADKRADHKGALSVNITYSDGRIDNLMIPISDVTIDENNVTTYFAAMGNSQKVRFSVVLTSYIKNSYFHRWEADIRHGYGWCGAMDSTMKLVGAAQPVLTTMNN